MLAGSAIASLVISAMVILLVSNARIRREANAAPARSGQPKAWLDEKDSALDTAAKHWIAC